MQQVKGRFALLCLLTLVASLGPAFGKEEEARKKKPRPQIYEVFHHQDIQLGADDDHIQVRVHGSNLHVYIYTDGGDDRIDVEDLGQSNYIEIYGGDGNDHISMTFTRSWDSLAELDGQGSSDSYELHFKNSGSFARVATGNGDVLQNVTADKKSRQNSDYQVIGTND